MDGERLAVLERQLRRGFGLFNRYSNEVADRYGPAAGVEQRVEVAEAVLAGGPLGVLQAMYEHGRRRRREAGLPPPDVGSLSPDPPTGLPPGPEDAQPREGR